LQVCASRDCKRPILPASCDFCATRSFFSFIRSIVPLLFYFLLSLHIQLRFRSRLRASRHRARPACGKTRPRHWGAARAASAGPRVQPVLRRGAETNSFLTEKSVLRVGGGHRNCMEVFQTTVHVFAGLKGGCTVLPTSTRLHLSSSSFIFTGRRWHLERRQVGHANWSQF